MPATIPVEEPMVAIEGVLLVHTPPVVVLVSVVAIPAHAVAVPDIAATVGSALTVTDLLTEVVQLKLLVTK
jgi:hypothetical protein